MSLNTQVTKTAALIVSKKKETDTDKEFEQAVREALKEFVADVASEFIASIQKTVGTKPSKKNAPAKLPRKDSQEDLQRTHEESGIRLKLINGQNKARSEDKLFNLSSGRTASFRAKDMCKLGPYVCCKLGEEDSEKVLEYLEHSDLIIRDSDESGSPRVTENDEPEEEPPKKTKAKVAKAKPKPRPKAKKVAEKKEEPEEEPPKKTKAKVAKAKPKPRPKAKKVAEKKEEPEEEPEEEPPKKTKTKVAKAKPKPRPKAKKVAEKKEEPEGEPEEEPPKKTKTKVAKAKPKPRPKAKKVDEKKEEPEEEPEEELEEETDIPEDLEELLFSWPDPKDTITREQFKIYCEGLSLQKEGLSDEEFLEHLNQQGLSQDIIDIIEGEYIYFADDKYPGLAPPDEDSSDEED